MKIVAYSLLLLTVLSAPAGAGTIKGAYAGCLTEDALDEMVTAASNNDTRQISALLNNLCFLIEGREYSIVDRGFIVSQIRVYAGGSSIVLWTPTSALQD